MANLTNNRGKCLSQVRTTSTSAVVLYSPARGIVTEIQTIVVSNSDAGTALYHLFHDDDGETWDESTNIAWEVSKATNTVDVITLTLWMSDPNGSLACQQNTASAFTFTVYGIEHKKLDRLVTTRGDS